MVFVLLFMLAWLPRQTPAAFEGSQTWTSCPFTEANKPTSFDLGTGTFVLAVDCTVPAGVTLRFSWGSVIEVAAAKTLTINGEMTGGLGQRFAGSGVVKIDSPYVDGIYPHWWYDGRGDWTAAIQKAVDSGLFISTAGIELRFPAGVYPVSDTITISHDRTSIVGAGKQTTIFSFAPSSPKTLFKLSKGAAEMFDAHLSRFSIQGANQHKKVGIEIVDVSGATIEDVSFYPFTGGNSECILLRGREFTTLNRITTNGDLPIHIADNPNSTIDADHLSVLDGYFIASNPSPGPIVLVDSGANLTNVNFQRNAWVGGSNGFYWQDTTSNQTSESLTFRDIRWEQQKGKTGEIVHISHNTDLYNIRLENLRWGGDNPSNGIFLRKVRAATIANVIYDQAGTAVDIESASIDGVHFESVYLTNPAATVRLNGARRVSGCYFIAASTFCFTP